MSTLVINIAAEYGLASKRLLTIFKKAFDPGLLLCDESRHKYGKYEAYGGSLPFSFNATLIDSHERKAGTKGKLWDVGEYLGFTDKYHSYYDSMPHVELCKTLERAGPYKGVRVCFTEAQISALHATRPDKCRLAPTNLYLADALTDVGFAVNAVSTISVGAEASISLLSYRLLDDAHLDLSPEQVGTVYRAILDRCTEHYDTIQQTAMESREKEQARDAKLAADEAEWYRRKYPKGNTRKGSSLDDAEDQGHQDEADWHRLNDWK
jgi:hypothetical protein